MKIIKSTYFIKILFSYIDDGHKLRLLKYNKNLQKFIDISIINYKFFQENIYYTNQMELEKNIMAMMIHYYLKVNI